MPAISKLIFLPGASGRRDIWKPVSERLQLSAARSFMGWPGFGDVPPAPNVCGLDDLVARVIAELDQPTALLAQSMGGVIAVRAALAKPEYVKRLVLAVTSGGIDVRGLGGEAWQAGFARANPQLPRWFVDDQQDLTVQLEHLHIPTLLLWGDADPISPVTVGRRLLALLPQAELRIVSGGDHDLVSTYAEQVAPYIQQHLSEHQHDA